MRRVKRSAIVPYTAPEMFELVDRVEQYADFLPWCSASEEHSRTDDEVRASLELNKGSLSREFSTRNVRTPYERIEMHLLDGPFSHLEGVWTFDALGKSGSKINLDIEFEFASMMVGMMFGSYFEQTCNSLVDAFTRRARAVYG
jgi:ribosome-associated toxin RatA of RatAB toxin-antitoxin module